MESLLSGHFVAQCLHSAAVLGIADLIATGHATAGELAAATGSHGPYLHRLLCVLASKGVLTEMADGHFGLTPLGETLRSDAPNSLWDKAVFETSTPVWAAMGGLLDTVRGGQPSFPRLHNATIYQYLADHAELAAAFNGFMTAQSNLHNAAIVEHHDFSAVRSLVDVGGGHGATLAAVLSRYPGMRGVLFDLAEVVAGASFETSDLADRCEARAGDMLESVPVGGDAYIIKRVMMDKTDEDAVTVLRNCRAAMNRGAKVLVVDPMLPGANQPHPNWLADMLMMVLTYGRCRTERQFRELFDAAGLDLTRVVLTNSPNAILEGAER